MCFYTINSETLPPVTITLKDPLGENHIGDHVSLGKITNTRFTFQHWEQLAVSLAEHQ